MAAFIVALFLAVTAIALLVSQVRIWSQNAERAVLRVHDRLRKPVNIGPSIGSEVQVKGARPLPDHMIIDIADAKGYRYQGEGGRGATVLRFTPPKSGKLSR